MRRSILRAGSCLLATLFSIGTAYAGMATPGQFGVSPSGAATYTIPIQTPPGTANIAPTLALAYNSQGGNGLLGLGWSLSGLSTITRCPRTMAQDSVRGGVNYDANDRYCLDGKRLVVSNGQPYGNNGTEYRTEIDSFLKITSYASTAGSPDWFRVQTKSGQVMEYGHTVDSKVLAQGKSAARVWALNKLSDSNSNYFTVTYSPPDAINGDYYPQRIDYTGNANTGTPTNNSIQFVYQTRPDAIPFYQAGSLVKNTVSLTNIKTYTGATLVKDYQLIYETNQSQRPARVMSIHECAGSGYCVPSVDLQFVNQIGDYFSASFTGTQIPLGGGLNFGTPGAYQLIVGDFDGDGKTDFALIGGAPTRAFVFLSNGDGTFTPLQSILHDGWNFGAPINANYRIITGDFNGDGKTDFAFEGVPGNDNIFTFISNGDGTFAGTLQPLTSANGMKFNSSYELIIGDFNGDGRTDFAYVGYAGNTTDTGVYVFLSQGDGTFLPSAQTLHTGWNFGSPLRDNYRPIVGDFNGDGKTDFALEGAPNNDYIYTFISNGDGTFTGTVQPLTSANGMKFNYTYELIIGDFNGDGKTDFAYVGYAGNTNDTGIYVFLSQGDGTFLPSAQTLHTGWNFGSPLRNTYLSVTGDFNGDGKTDFALIGAGGDTQYYVLISQGDGTFAGSAGVLHSGWHFGSPPQAGYIPIIGDFNGDGKIDFILLDYSLALPFTFLTQTGTTDVAQFKNTLGQTNAISYKPLTDSAVYVKDSGTNTAVYPKMDLKMPQKVVYSATGSDGIGGTLTNYYQYGGLKADLSGRGRLGFRWMQFYQNGTGLGSRTEYLQDFPYTGAPSFMQKTIPGGGNGTVLSQSTTTYGCTDFISSSGCAVTPGRRYFVYPANNFTASWDLNGAALPTTTTTSQYDTWNATTQTWADLTQIYGNLTQIVTSTSDGYSTTTNNIYTNDIVNWRLGLLTRSTVTTTTP